MQYGLFQIHFGDMDGEQGEKSKQRFVKEALKRFFPTRYLEAFASTKHDRQTFEGCMLEKWISLKGRCSSDCVRIFLTCARKWQFFGAKLFEVQVETNPWTVLAAP